MNKCRGCGAQIEWIKTENGKSMPVNPEYIEIDITGPKIITVVTDAGTIELGSPVDTACLFQGENTVKGRISHFTTCPKAGSFRDRRVY